MLPEGSHVDFRASCHEGLGDTTSFSVALRLEASFDRGLPASLVRRPVRYPTKPGQIDETKGPAPSPARIVGACWLG
jgi:hypothetical protein